MKALLRRALKAAVARALRPYNYRLVNPDHAYGIDFIADIRRLARAYDIDVMTIFDVGANIGRTSLVFRRTWPRATIYAVEPSAQAAQALRTNAALHPPFSVEQIALGDRDGSAPFYEHEDAPDLNSLYAKSPFAERFARDGRVGEVAVATLDRFCAERRIARINVLKIDTEGADHDVLVGATELLRAGKIDFVYCEFNTLEGELGALRPIGELLARNGYDFVASYNDYITTEGAFFAVSNALFCRSTKAA